MINEINRRTSENGRQLSKLGCGEYFNYRILWDGALRLHDVGKERDEGFHFELAACLFIYLAFEGFVNFLGGRLFPDEWKKEKDIFSSKSKQPGTLGKYIYLANRCKINIAKNKRPFQTLSVLEKRRHAIVHSRTELINKIVEYDKQVKVIPTILTYGDTAFVERALEDVDYIADQLYEAAQKLYSPHIVGHGQKAFVGMIGHYGGWLE
jgi:hypothetical protein